MVQQIDLLIATPVSHIEVVTVPLPNQLPINVPGKAANNGLSVGGNATQVGGLLLASIWTSLGCLDHMVYEPINGRSLSLLCI